MYFVFFANFSRVMCEQVCGGRNLPAAMQGVAAKALEHSREMRYQSFNAYRKRFNMKPYSSFQEMTGKINSERLHVSDANGDLKLTSICSYTVDHYYKKCDLKSNPSFLM